MDGEYYEPSTNNFFFLFATVIQPSVVAVNFVVDIHVLHFARTENERVGAERMKI